MNSEFLIRMATEDDLPGVINLYRSVASMSGGLKARENGVHLIIQDTAFGGKIVGEIHCCKPEPKVFSHILSELTMAIDADYQGKSLGKKLLENFLDFIQVNREDVYRVELIARESNTRAIALYEKVGFKKEGRMEGRIKNHPGGFEADFPMVWLNPGFKR